MCFFVFDLYEIIILAPPIFKRVLLVCALNF